MVSGGVGRSSVFHLVGPEVLRTPRRRWLKLRRGREENWSSYRVGDVHASDRDSSRGSGITAVNSFPTIRFRLRVLATLAAVVPVLFLFGFMLGRRYHVAFTSPGVPSKIQECSRASLAIGVASRDR